MGLVNVAWNWSAFRRNMVAVRIQKYYSTAFGRTTQHSLRIAYERAGRMQHLLIPPTLVVYTVGTQVVADATTVGRHVDITVIPS